MTEQARQFLESPEGIALKCCVQHILDYMWHDEKKHCSGCERDERGGHIFGALVDLDNFIYGTDVKLEDYFEDEDDAEERDLEEATDEVGKATPTE
jgi:hypothetical protein